MKHLFLLFFVIGVSLAFTIERYQINIKPYKLTSTGSCSEKRLKFVNQSIQACRYQTEFTGAVCVQKTLQNFTNQEKWNVMAQSTNTSDAQTSYWFYNDCSIIYEQTSPIKSKFTIWKATSNSNQQKPSNESNIQKNNKLQTYEDEDCTQQRLTAAYYALYICQNNNSSLQVICIKNTMMTKMRQKWDAVAYTKPGMGIQYYYFNGCNVIMNNYGQNNRNYLIWKAQ